MTMGANMRWIGAALLLTGLSAGSIPAASAADLARGPVYQAPIYNWQGFYVGGNVGYAWGSSDVTTIATGLGTYFEPTSLPVVNTSGIGTINPSGFAGGAQAGFNWQISSLILGFELDFNAFSTTDSRSVSAAYPCCPPFTFTIFQKVSTNWLFTARPRVGYAMNNWLLYATGGLAVTKLNYTNTFTDTIGATESGSVSKTQAGWTIGGGVEVAWTSNWTAKAEYLFADFGSVSSTGTLLHAPSGQTAPFAHTADFEAHIVRVGINYRFGG
jgi:outer membrane immunogenic protein